MRILFPVKQSGRLCVLEQYLTNHTNNMETMPENQDQENKPASGEAEKGKDNEELAREIPTVTPNDDDEDLEPNQEKG